MRNAALLVLLLVAAARAEVPSEWLVIEKVDQRGRRPFNPDRVFARYLLDPEAPPPEEGQKVGDVAWKKVAVDEKGFVQGRHAYAYAALESPRNEIVLAQLQNGGRLYVNGDGFVGDIYGMRHSGVPIQLLKGTNHLYVRGMRGRFRLELKEVEKGVHIAERDATLPHLVPGQARRVCAAVLLNASADGPNRFQPYSMRLGWKAQTGGQEPSPWLPPLVPLGLRKIAFHPDLGDATPGKYWVEVSAKERNRRFTLEVRKYEEA
ncbi:MAG: hypothetical protein ACYTGK_04745, partial [Planctomycetota bacterium]